MDDARGIDKVIEGATWECAAREGGTCECDGARRATDDAWRRATTP